MSRTEEELQAAFQHLRLGTTGTRYHSTNSELVPAKGPDTEFPHFLHCLSCPALSNIKLVLLLGETEVGGKLVICSPPEAQASNILKLTQRKHLCLNKPSILRLLVKVPRETI